MLNERRTLLNVWSQRIVQEAGKFNWNDKVDVEEIAVVVAAYQTVFVVVNSAVVVVNSNFAAVLVALQIHHIWC